MNPLTYAANSTMPPRTTRATRISELRALLAKLPKKVAR